MRAVPVVFMWLVLAAVTTVTQPPVDALATAPGAPATACVPTQAKPCTYADLSGANIYTVDVTSLTRVHQQRRGYSITLAGGAVSILGVAANAKRSQLVVVIGQESRSAGSAFNNAGAIPPDGLTRQFWLSIRNPKTGDEIKSIGLGQFQPATLAVSPPGDYVWMLGDERQQRRREVRCYNTRSGRREYEEPVARESAVAVFEGGFRRDGTYYGLARTRTYNSPDGYSIAEFTVLRKDGQPSLRTVVGKQTIGVIGFQNLRASLKDNLDAALVNRLRGAGFELTDRNRLELVLQELQLQEQITDPKTRLALGHIANAQHLLVAVLARGETMTTIALQTHAVETGGVGAAIELECRDCTEDDYAQALTYLVQDWAD